MANTGLVSMDVLSLERSLRDHLRGQAEFADYDFEGSNLSTLIRLLSFNTFLNSFYLNMVHSEGFLDSAQTRASVISHAKELNYVPRSARSARARIRLTFTGTEPTYLIEKGKTFSATVGNAGLVFSVPETILMASTTGQFSQDIDICEGTYVTDTYVMDPSDPAQRFVLTNPGADTTSLTVVIYEDGEVTGTSYGMATSMLGIDGTSKVYFLQATEEGYQVLFGDGVVGHKPADGSVIAIDYRVTTGSDGNGARVFSRDFEIGPGISRASVELISPAVGGSEAEDIESIRYYAPRHFQAQERAVTTDDYAVLLKTQFPEIKNVAAFGGEEVDPPRYGEVIIAVDIADVDGIPESLLDQYTKFMTKRSAMKPVFVTPNRVYLDVSTEVDYNLNRTTLQPQTVAVIVAKAIEDFANDNLNSFDASFRYSNLVSAIDRSHDSIDGNKTTIRIYQEMVPTLGQPLMFTLDLGAPLLDSPSVGTQFPSSYQRTLRTTAFVSGGERRFLTDDGSGSVWLAANRGTQTMLLRKVGSISYARGLIKVNNLVITGFDNDAVRFYCVPENGQDIDVRRDTILEVRPGDVHVVATGVRD